MDCRIFKEQVESKTTDNRFNRIPLSRRGSDGVEQDPISIIPDTDVITGFGLVG
jgi:hypothetical protein